MNYSLIHIFTIVISTFLASALLVPLIKKVAFHIGAIDIPNKRKVHTKPMPRLGGVAIYLSFLLGYMLFSKQSIEMLSILIGGFIIVITGVIDDIRPIKAKYKLASQIIAASVVVFYGGLILENIDAFGFYIDFDIMSYPITILFIIGITNAINLIDGLDGLAAGVSSIFFLTIGIIAVILNKLGGLDVALSFIMLGSTLGFLVHNFYPAKIFMGDSGSLFLGFTISVIGLLGFKNVTLTSFIVPVLILGVPIFDTTCAIIRRIVNKIPISEPDKNHLHHQLLKMNYSHRATVLIIYYIDALFAFASIIYVLNNRSIGIFLYITLLLIVLWFIIKTNIILSKSQDIKK